MGAPASCPRLPDRRRCAVGMRLRDARSGAHIASRGCDLRSAQVAQPGTKKMIDWKAAAAGWRWEAALAACIFVSLGVLTLWEHGHQRLSSGYSLGLRSM